MKFRIHKPKIYQNCDEIPINTFFIDVGEKHDYSKLCYYGKATNEELSTAWNNIVTEFEKRIGSRKLMDEMEESVDLVIINNRINMLIAIYHIKRINKDYDVSALEEYLGIKGISLERLEQKILLEQTRINIKKIKNESLKKRENKGKKPLTFFDTKAILEKMLNTGHLDGNKVVLSEWISYWKQLDELTSKN